MPTYEYRCRACDQRLEVAQAFTDDPLTTCEACGGELRKVFGNVGIAFKGNGFYKTDSRGPSKSSGSSGSDSSSAGDSSTSGSSSGSDSSSGGDSKPAAAKGSDPKPVPAPAATTT